MFLGSVSDIRNNTFYAASGSVVNVTQLQSGSEFKFNIVIYDYAGTLRILYTNDAVDIDYNVYIRNVAGTTYWQDTVSGTAFSLAEWRSESGHDTNSVLLDASGADDLFLNGVAGLLDGDFRLDPTYAGTFVDGTPIVGNAGIQEYYDWNAREVVAGQPSKWLTAPETLSECESYIADPGSWNFYP
jgi:hypothetical protein